jgi:hypothetical protein
MKSGTPPSLRRFVSIALAGILVVVLAACRGVGGGYLPPKEPAGFTGQAPFGFTFSCEDSGGINPPTGQLRIQLSYSDHGTSPLAKSPFSIHGIVDTIDPVLESIICIGQKPPPDPPGENVLTFLGRYRLTSSAPSGFPTTCPTRETPTAPLCRFEVTVQDNDRNLAPSTGDFFSIKLSSATAVTSTLPLVFYARAGNLAGGNLTVR